jgi:DNA-binding response OmpR family regulator
MEPDERAHGPGGRGSSGPEGPELLLGRAGLQVVAARDGEAALEAFYLERTGAVVLDIELPGLDGWTLLDRIREFSDVIRTT